MSGNLNIKTKDTFRKGSLVGLSPPSATTISLSDALLTVQSDAELSPFLVVLHSKWCVNVEDVHLCSLSHNVCVSANRVSVYHSWFESDEKRIHASAR